MAQPSSPSNSPQNAAITPGTTPITPSTGWIGPGIVFGFGSAILLWTTWFVTHLPTVRTAAGLTPATSIGIVLAVWAIALAVGGFAFVRSRAATPSLLLLKTGALAGVVASLLGLLLLGSKLTEKPYTEMGPANFKPNAALIAGGFLLLGLVMGVVATHIGAAIARIRPASSPSPVDWRSCFAWVTVGAILPLLFIGGLVTSTDSGMAVPDWPQTYGANMFLYPLGTAPEDIFLEHAHRLFGTLLGLTAIALTVWTFIKEPRKSIKIITAALFLAVVAQGILGAGRVLEDDRLMAAFHGVSAQIILAGFVTLAVMMLPAYRAAAGATPSLKPIRILATATLHLTFVQLIFGAIFRQFRNSNHALWSHAGFSMVVLIAAVIAGFLIISRKPAQTAAHADRPIARLLQNCGLALLILYSVQILLGWMTFFMGVPRLAVPENFAQALLRTTHQANGALLIVTATIACVVAKRIAPKRAAAGASASAPTPAAATA